MLHAGDPRWHLDGRLLAEAGRYANRTGILLYYHAADTLFSWLIDDGGVGAGSAVAVSHDALVRGVAGYRAALGAGAGGGDRSPSRSGVREVTTAPSPDIDVPAHLLPAPIADRLTSYDQLVVVPVLNLGTVPFAALPIGDRHVVDHAAVSIAPSLWNLFWEYESQSPRSTTMRGLVIGNPDFRGETEWTLPDLPGAEEEAGVVASLLDTAVVLVGRDATEEAVLAQMYRVRPSVLHVATHGISDAGDPLLGSFLALTGGDRLTALEIQRARGEWPRVVVMSACETGLGMTDLGGIIGLARAFQLAGVPDVVMSLWKVNDAATVHFMRRFYTHLPRLYPAEAVRAAALDTRSRYPSPSIWAAFTTLSVQQQ